MGQQYKFYDGTWFLNYRPEQWYKVCDKGNSMFIVCETTSKMTYVKNISPMLS